MENKDSPIFWPFPSELPKPTTNIPLPKFNPDNFEDALL